MNYYLATQMFSSAIGTISNIMNQSI